MRSKLLLKFVFTLIIFISISQPGYSQSKYYKRLNRKFQKAKYEKVLRKADRYIRRNPANSIPYYFKAKTYLLLYSQTNENLLLIKSLQNFNRLRGKTIPSYIEVEVSNLKLREISNAEDAISKDKYHKYSKRISSLITKIKTISNKKSKYVKVSKNSSSYELPIDKKRLEVVNRAEDLIGIPYKYGGTSSKGFDCSGFTQYVYKFIGIKLPRTAEGQYEHGKVIKQRNAKVGDLVVFSKYKGNKINHVSMIAKVKNGKMVSVIHSTSRGVVEDYINDSSWQSYWKKRMRHIITYISK